MKKLLACLLMFCCLAVKAQLPHTIVPAPAQYKAGTKAFLLDTNAVLIANKPESKKTALLFNEHLHSLGLPQLRITSSGKDVKKYIFLVINVGHTYRNPDVIPEYYDLQVNSRHILLSAANERGLFYGLQTLFQLLPAKGSESLHYPLSIPPLSIQDYPRFAYRGMHLDVARHFFPVEEVKKYIDYLAMYKFNTFHWHLTDDQGWRIEIKKYPLLTQIGSCRAQTLVGPYGTNKYDGKKYCGYYTQEEIKEVVRYAAERHINVIPEIEMPGHALAALASYNYLGCTKGPYKAAETWGVFDDVFCAGNDSIFTFLQDVLDEVTTLFPSKMIHIGGDESPKTRWKTCPDCQRRMKNEQLKDEHELQSYFIQRIEKYLNSKGRNIIGWDEILEGGLAPNAAVMSWRGEDGGITAAKQHHKVVMTPGNYLYFDHSQSNNEDSITFGGYNSLEKVYSYEPIPAALSTEESDYIVGAQANLWTEYITNPKKIEYQLFPRLAALSEVLWSPKEKRNWNDFERRLPEIFNRLQRAGINYSDAYYDLSTSVVPTADHNGVIWKIKSGNCEYKNIRVKAKFARPITVEQHYPKYDEHGYIKEDSVAMRTTDEVEYNNNDSIHVVNTVKLEATLKCHHLIYNPVYQNFEFNKATGKKIDLVHLPSSSYPGSGAFTLVDGVQNNTGMSKSSQFLGFSGDDLEATIDLGINQTFDNITLRVFEQTASWIYRPQFVSFYTSDNGKDFQLLGNSMNNDNDRFLQYSFEKPAMARYIKVIAKNAGTIKDGNPGAGNEAWLFVDEIEVK